VAGLTLSGRVPASGYVAAGLIAGVRESSPDGRDSAEPSGHKPPSLKAVPEHR